MKGRSLALVLLACAAGFAPGAARARGKETPGRGAVVLDGERVPVRWTDGDSFRILGGRFAGSAARLGGVNALETYGPVHRIAGLDGRALHALARKTATLAAGGEWSCTAAGDRDRYRRLLVHCPEAALALVRAGHAMVFSLDGPAGEELLAAQRDAQGARRGIWAGGVPPLVPTSLHSADEPDLGARGAYDRIADTRTGEAAARSHERRYRPCEEVCLGEGEGKACMTYVPYERRYRRKPACLR